MNIEERLRRLGVREASPAGPAPGEPEGPAGFGPGELGSSETGPLAASAISTNCQGSFLLRKVFFPLDHAHGAFHLSEALGCEARVLGMLARDRRMGALDLGRAVFLDTETTGLSGGTGTVAFLVGLAAFEPGGFRVRQLFMRDYDEEPALLHYLATALEDASGVVTYNGKAFDLPLLATRFVANRQHVRELAELPHLDLLHTARRLWRHGLPEVSLAQVERSVLAVGRTNDIPGMMIPALYFRYLRSRQAELMEPVFSHNLLDLLSLVSVISAGARACRGEGNHGGECFGVARTLEAMREPGSAVASYRRALDLAVEPGLEQHVRKALARTLARLGDHDAAAVEWQALADAHEDLDALEALAKRAEHRLRDFELALGYVERALGRLGSPLLRSVAALSGRREAFLTRRVRLQKKAAGRSSRRRLELDDRAVGVQQQ